VNYIVIRVVVVHYAHIDFDGDFLVVKI